MLVEGNILLFFWKKEEVSHEASPTVLVRLIFLSSISYCTGKTDFSQQTQAFICILQGKVQYSFAGLYF
jgi:hypothetical protein